MQEFGLTKAYLAQKKDHLVEATGNSRLRRFLVEGRLLRIEQSLTRIIDRNLVLQCVEEDVNGLLACLKHDFPQRERMHSSYVQGLQALEELGFPTETIRGFRRAIREQLTPMPSW